MRFRMKLRDEITLDGADSPITIHARVDILDDSIRVDYSGSSEQVSYGINCMMVYTYAYTCVSDQVSHRSADAEERRSYAPIEVVAPLGSINPRTWRRNARHIVGHALSGVIMGALSQVLPERVVADLEARRRSAPSSPARTGTQIWPIHSCCSPMAGWRAVA